MRFKNLFAWHNYQINTLQLDNGLCINNIHFSFRCRTFGDISTKTVGRKCTFVQSKHHFYSSLEENFYQTTVWVDFYVCWICRIRTVPKLNYWYNWFQKISFIYSFVDCDKSYWEFLFCLTKNCYGWSAVRFFVL